MQRAWFFERFAITVASIDFVDPALGNEVGARERGVRVEVRRLESRLHGSGYASPEIGLAPAVCRIDLLESGPGLGDRMHWHPTMAAGEPGDRTMEPAMATDPAAWLRTRLLGFDGLLARSGEAAASDADLASVRRSTDEITDCVARSLASLRAAPWGAVVHDERGLAELD